MITAVLFSAHNCGYCPGIKKIFNELKVDYEDCDVNLTTVELGPQGENMDVFKQWNITGVPVVSIINRKNGEVAEEQARLVGSEEITKEKLVYCIESHLNE